MTTTQTRPTSDAAYVILALALGVIGMHRFYASRTKSAFLMLGLWIVAFPLFFAQLLFFALLIWVGLVIWVLVDLTRIHQINQ